MATATGKKQKTVAQSSRADAKPESAQAPVAKKNPTKAKAAKAEKPAKVETEAKPVKSPKPKLVRDSFTIPKLEYAAVDELKQRAARLGQPAKKSELLRAGLKVLSAMPDDALLASLAAVPSIKTGRPAKA